MITITRSCGDIQPEQTNLEEMREIRVMHARGLWALAAATALVGVKIGEYFCMSKNWVNLNEGEDFQQSGHCRVHTLRIRTLSYFYFVLDEKADG